MDGRQAEQGRRGVLLGAPRRAGAHDVGHCLDGAIGVHDALLVGLEDRKVEQRGHGVELEPGVLGLEQGHQHRRGSGLSDERAVVRAGLGEQPDLVHHAVGRVRGE